MIQQTSLIEYLSIKKRIQKEIIKTKVYRLLREYCVGLTAWEVAKLLRLPITSVRPRLTDLVRDGLAEYGEKRICSVIKKRCITYRVIICC